jgi:four helix bundle protein
LREEGTKGNSDLEQRTFRFAVDVVKFLKTIKYSKENDVIKYQLAKAATSIGANLPCGIK